MNLWFDTMLQHRSFRALVCCLALIGEAGNSNLHAAALSTPAMTVVKGGTASTRIEYRSQGSAVSDLQFDLQYDRSVLYIEVSIGSAPATVGKTLSTNVLSNGDLRIMISGLNQTVIADGDVVDLNIKMGALAPTGAQPLGVTNVVGVASDGTKIDVQARDGRIIAVPNGPPN